MQREISAVIPVYNEEESLRELHAQLIDSFKKMGKSYEIIFIDDGSIDNSLEILKNFERKTKDGSIKVLSFRKNLGKSYAFMLGFKEATGKYVVTLDADLQDDPKNIKLLYEKLTKGKYDLVTGWRKDRKDNPVKKISSRFSNKVFAYLFKLQIHDFNGGLKLYKQEVAKDLRIYGGMHRFIPLLANELGYRVGEKEIIHHPRKYGHSKYKATKIITDVPDLVTIYFLTKYTRRPLHFFGKIGTVVFLIGFLILFYLTLLWFSGQTIGRRPLLFLGILLVTSGVQITLTGLIADLIVNRSIKDDNNFPLKYGSAK